jgi:hypothetical protein
MKVFAYLTMAVAAYAVAVPEPEPQPQLGKAFKNLHKALNANKVSGGGGLLGKLGGKSRRGGLLAKLKGKIFPQFIQDVIIILLISIHFVPTCNAISF